MGRVGDTAIVFNPMFSWGSSDAQIEASETQCCGNGLIYNAITTISPLPRLCVSMSPCPREDPGLNTIAVPPARP